MTPSIQTRFPKRQTVLFLLALAAPCLVLAGLGLQVSRQERQLAEKRAVEDQQRRLAQFRSDLVTELERIKRQAAAGRSHDAVVLTAAVRDGALLLPFDGDAHAREIRRALQSPEFGGSIRAAEREEISQRYVEAAGHYRGAVTAAHLPWERTYAGLLLARAEGKAGRVEEARKCYRPVLRSPAELHDEYGIPLALYAAGALLESAADRPSVARVLREQAAVLPQMATPALAMMRDLARKLDAIDLLPELNRLFGGREQAEALEASAPVPHATSRAQSPHRQRTRTGQEATTKVPAIDECPHAFTSKGLVAVSGSSARAANAIVDVS